MMCIDSSCCCVSLSSCVPAATSGLDSYTSNEVMTVVKGLTKDGTTVAATIHSPSSTCYSLFDKVRGVSCSRFRGRAGIADEPRSFV
jgi:hypothetical protein